MNRVTFFEAVGGHASMRFSELAEVYKATLIKTHPDANVGCTAEEHQEHEAAYKRATEAWSILQYSSKRQAYIRLCWALGKECPACKGKGATKHRKTSLRTIRTTVGVICEDCGGTGAILTAKDTPEAEALRLKND